MADKALNLYRALQATPVDTYVSLFTTLPTADHPTAHGAVEWGPARVRVYPNSLAGSPYWSAPSELTDFVRYIYNVGSISWSSVTLTTSPSTVLGAGVFDALTDGNLLTWYTLTEDVIVTDGANHTFGTADFKIKGD